MPRPDEDGDEAVARAIACRGVVLALKSIAGNTRRDRPFGPPDVGSPKSRENETGDPALQFLTLIHLSYNIGLLRCFHALPLYASLIRDQKVGAGTARVPSGRLHPDGTGSGLGSSMRRFR
jgi:hypothetical protein